MCPLIIAAAAGNESASLLTGAFGLHHYYRINKGHLQPAGEKIPVIAHGNDVSAPGI